VVLMAGVGACARADPHSPPLRAICACLGARTRVFMNVHVWVHVRVCMCVCVLGGGCLCAHRMQVVRRTPDLAEAWCLCRLYALCRAVEALYPPGCHVTLVADGLVYAPIFNEATDVALTYRLEVHLPPPPTPPPHTHTHRHRYTQAQAHTTTRTHRFPQR
jgi:hypothetical protein